MSHKFDLQITKWVVNAVAYLAHYFKLLFVKRVSGTNDADRLLPKIGDAIRCARKEQGLSQEALADASGIDRSHLGRIERGERNLTVLNLKKIANALESQVWQLLKLSDI